MLGTFSSATNAQRAQEIFQDAAYAGASSVKDLTKGLDNPSSEKLQRNVHAARNLSDQEAPPKNSLA